MVAPIALSWILISRKTSHPISTPKKAEVLLTVSTYEALVNVTATKLVMSVNANKNPVATTCTMCFFENVFLISLVLFLSQMATMIVPKIMFIDVHVSAYDVTSPYSIEYFAKTPPIDINKAPVIASMLPFSRMMAFIGSRMPFLLSDA